MKIVDNLLDYLATEIAEEVKQKVTGEDIQDVDFETVANDILYSVNLECSLLGTTSQQGYDNEPELNGRYIVLINSFNAYIATGDNEGDYYASSVDIADLEKTIQYKLKF